MTKRSYQILSCWLIRCAAFSPLHSTAPLPSMGATVEPWLQASLSDGSDGPCSLSACRHCNPESPSVASIATIIRWT